MRSARKRLGWSQAELARRVGVSRQALVAIEAGRQIPSTSVALRLAQVLGQPVEQLFSLASEPSVLVDAFEAHGGLGESTPAVDGRRVYVGRVGERWIAHALPEDSVDDADGVLGPRSEGDAVESDTSVELWRPRPEVERNVLCAGCAPLLGLWSNRARLGTRDVRVRWLPTGSRNALSWLASDRVHIAGVHSHRFVSEEGLDDALRADMPETGLTIVHLTRWRQGLVVAKGNPHAIRGPADLQRADLRLVAREAGSGAADLLLELCGEGAVPEHALPARDHFEVAHAIRCGAADVGVAIESVAIAFGLDFIPLSEERFDLVLKTSALASPSVSQTLDLLTDASFRREAILLPGYDLAGIGDRHEVRR